jgi:hypothetical protein
MKRRAFIQRSLLFASGLIGTSVLRAHTWSGASQNGRLGQLPAATGQIRHGMFEWKRLHGLGLPSWLKLYQTQRFFANGHLAGGEDLHVLRCDMQGKPVLLGYSEGNHYLMLEGETEHHSNGLVKVWSNGARVKLASGLHFVLVLRGNARIHGHNYVLGEYCISDETSEVICSEDALVLYLRQP